MMTTKGRLNGYHVLFMLLAFFGIMIAVNVAFTVFAVKSFPGEQVEKSYVQGINYNQTIASREHQAELGVKSEIGLETLASGKLELVALWQDQYDNPLTQLQVKAEVSRPASNHGQIVIDLNGVSPGRYEAEIENLAAGKWNILITAITSDGETLTAQKSVLWAQ